MNGVEILTTYAVDVGASYSDEIFIKTFLIIMGLAIGIGIYLTIKEKDWGMIICGGIVGVAMSLLIGVPMGLLGFTQPTGQETHYKVTITEEVSMIEFLERYEVIDRDGKIFTVREKTNEE